MNAWLELGYLGLFLASFLAATILPFSSEALLSVLIVIGFDPMTCMLVATTGNWTGGMSGYYLGRIGKWTWLERYFKIKRHKMEHWQKDIVRFGELLAFLCWLPFVGDFIAVALGFFRCNILGTAFFMFLGKMLRYVVWIYITVYFKRSQF